MFKMLVAMIVALVLLLNAFARTNSSTSSFAPVFSVARRAKHSFANSLADIDAGFYENATAVAAVAHETQSERRTLVMHIGTHKTATSR
jgi:hypothetical protein